MLNKHNTHESQTFCLFLFFVQPVVADGDTIKNFDEKFHSHVESEYDSITTFDVDITNGERFDPPIVEIADVTNANADDVIALLIDG
jgi:hypothetical protein